MTEHSVDKFYTSEVFNRLHDTETVAYFALFVYGSVESDGFVRVKNTRHSVPKHWEPVILPGAINYFPEKGRNLNGLKFDVWLNRNENKVVIAFRGTRFSHWQDWYSNLRWVTRFIPGVNDFYVQTQSFIPQLVTWLRQTYGDNTELVTAGHSLGGGLAQYAGYNSPHIRMVYGFAPSFVTGYRNIERTKRGQGKTNMLIARVFEHGEILAYVRFFLRKLIALSVDNPEIVELRFNCSNSGAISQHSMGKMAERLTDKLGQELQAGLPRALPRPRVVTTAAEE
ncbi:MAG: hypothetical protein V3U76_03080 [Granulosicoccus sp.]